MTSPGPAQFEVEAFYDGRCPLCVRWMRRVERRDRLGRIRFVDVTAAGFDARTVGRGQGALLERIHGRLPDGRVIEGVEVLRRLLAAVGFRRSAAVSRWPGVAALLDVTYRLVARHRYRLPGRCEACAMPMDQDAGRR